MRIWMNTRRSSPTDTFRQPTCCLTCSVSLLRWAWVSHGYVMTILPRRIIRSLQGCRSSPSHRCVCWRHSSQDWHLKPPLAYRWGQSMQTGLKCVAIISCISVSHYSGPGCWLGPCHWDANDRVQAWFSPSSASDSLAWLSSLSNATPAEVLSLAMWLPILQDWPWHCSPVGDTSLPSACINPKPCCKPSTYQRNLQPTPARKKALSVMRGRWWALRFCLESLVLGAIRRWRHCLD